MSSLRPAARTMSPDGREWEIYAYALQLPRREPLEQTHVGNAPSVQGAVIDGVVYVVLLVPRMLVRVFYDFPIAALRAARSDTCLIEAVSWAPYPVKLRWEISKERKGQALAQVEGQLARGEQPMLRNAKQLLY
jgi:hypothetical protein